MEVDFSSYYLTNFVVTEETRNLVKSLNNKYGVRGATIMLPKVDYIVHIKSGNDEEYIPCVNLETAQFVVRNLKRYGYKVSEIEIIDSREEAK